MSSSRASTWSAAKTGLHAIAITLAVGLLAGISPAGAQTDGTSVGLKGGANWSILDRPRDPAGEPTLMNGAAFDGVGTVAGLAIQHRLGDLFDRPLLLEVDLMYTRHRAGGFEHHPRTDARRSITLQTDGLRIPVLLEWFPPTSDLYVGLGPELWTGLRAGAELDQQNVDAPLPSFRTTTVTHVMLAAVVGWEWQVSPDVAFPVELRGAWDPLVGQTTVDRFEGYHSPDRPGRFQVAFDWQFLGMVGVMWQGL